MLEFLREYTENGEMKFPETYEEIKEVLREQTLFLMGVDNDIKEKISIELLKATHIEDKHGWDGHHDNFFIEVKSETQAKDGVVSAKGNFNNLSWNSIQKYKEQGILMFTGFSRKGVMLYSVACDIKHVYPLLEEALLEKFPSRIFNKGENVSPSISLSKLPKESFEVIYYPSVSDNENFAGDLRKVLENNRIDKVKCGVMRDQYLCKLKRATSKPSKSYEYSEMAEIMYGSGTYLNHENGYITPFTKEGVRINKAIKTSSFATKFIRYLNN